MGIDADAYMAGAIPSLNRGGSWRMDDRHGSQFQSLYGHGEGSGTSGSIFPRPSQIVPPLPPSTAAGVHANMNLNLGNRDNFHPFQSHAMSTIGYPPFMSPGSSMGSPSIRPDGGTAYVGSQSGGSRKAMSARPTLMLAGGRSQSGGSIGSRVQSVRSANHPGWASLSAGGGGGEASRVGGVEGGSANGRKSSPSSPTTPSSATFIAGQVTSQYGVKPSIAKHQGQNRDQLRPLVSPRVMEPAWDWESATPKSSPQPRVMTTEPDYFSQSHSPITMTMAPRSTPQTPISGHFDSVPPPPRPAAPQSPRPRVRAVSHKSQAPHPHRPSGPTRRHTHDRVAAAPDPDPVAERGARVMRLESKSLGRARVKSGFRPKLTFEGGSEMGGDGSYYAPSKTYAHTLDESTRTATSSMSPASSEKTRPGTTRRSTSSILPSSPLSSGITHLSFAEKRFKTRSHPALSTIGSSTTIDFTQTAPSSATDTGTGTIQTGRVKPSIDLRSLNEALPTSRPASPQTAPLHGYVHPTSEDDYGYDPYAAHPAPYHDPSTSSPSITKDNKPKAKGAGLKHVTVDTYRPPGFPKPVKELAWNREGPAMKTHGVAWLREAETDTLPCGPAGPRYIQARPPALAIQSGGSWWDSAA